MEDIEDIIEGVLEHPVEDNDAKGWIKKSFTKKWKKGFYVLRKYCSTDQAFVQWFDKGDNWRNQIAKGTLELFSQYRVLKHNEMKGKRHVFEVNNDIDTYILAAESETVMDLWVMQLQMQTRLNPRVEGRTFRIKGSGIKPMQRIGAKDQNCLLHISKWGITLALERTRAVLAQWPLTTIRNYESMDRGEFSFEAGRRSPMGEGKYTFFTSPGEDNRIFDTIDKFATQRLNARGGATLIANSEEEMSRAYDQLRFSVLNFNSEDDAHSHSSKPRPINNRQEDDSYSHIGRSDSIGSGRLSIGSFSASMDRTDGYNSIPVERHSSFGSRSEACPSSTVSAGANYDFLDHARSQINLSVKEGHGKFNHSQSGYSHISSSFRGTTDNQRKGSRSHPPDLSPGETAFSDDLMSPVSSSSLVPSDNSLSMSKDLAISPLQMEALSTSTIVESEPVPPPLPVRSKKRINNSLPVETMHPSVEMLPSKIDEKLPPTTPLSKQSDDQNGRGKTLPAMGRRLDTTEAPTEHGLSKTSASPNFIYLNSAHSKSVEVLSTLYATVDKSKKKKNREAAEKQRRKEYEALKQRRKSRSHESLAGSPRLNSFSFTPFTFRGLAAMDSSSSEDFYNQDFEIESEFVSAKAPMTERISMALRSSLPKRDKSINKAEHVKVNGDKPSSASSLKDAETLQKVISHSPRFGSKKKKANQADSMA